jgi:hypothetical protein
MNSYGSVSRVSESIYKLLRYMNWVSSNDVDKVNDDDAHVPLNPGAAVT